MTRNEHQSATTADHGDTDIGIVLTQPRQYRALKSALILGRDRALNARLVALSGAGSGDRVLDIGSGPGDLVRALARRVGPSGAVTGVDPSPPMIDYATAHSSALPNCRFELGPAQSLRLPDASIDIVTCTFVMHHIPEAQRDTAIGQMFRVLRPGGRLLLADTYLTGRLAPSVVKAMARYMARHRHDDAATGHPADPMAAVDIRRYRETLYDTGFRTTEFHTAKPVTGALLAIKPE
ncbi:methyltransferase domain-containing protein [Nocardia australiensis]|uniref:methyltransferase domain-containing protein n=1 Tax=Nocardia australiensis TaxID=2887191 RepID=UPI001D1462EB|nr:methyltransferase domain-containing protein [Nocardia australiensis]